MLFPMVSIIFSVTVYQSCRSLVTSLVIFRIDFFDNAKDDGRAPWFPSGKVAKHEA